MKKLLLLILCLLVMGQMAFAATITESPDNAVIVGPHMGQAGVTPATEVIKVYDTSTGTSTSETCAMVWDLTAGYNNGYYVKRASVDQGYAAAQTEQFAGIMVSKTSKDNSAYGPVGYMAIRGVCAAKVSSATQGNRLVVTGGTSEGTLSTSQSVRLSDDVGTCLGASGNPRTIWLD